MAWSWRIIKSAVEQEILFPSEDAYEKYLAGLIRKEEPFEIVDEMKNEDGTYTVVMRKRYNNTPFFRREDEISDEDFKKFIKKLFEEEAERIIAEVEADPTLKDVKAPPEMYENIMAQIRHRKECETL